MSADISKANIDRLDDPLGFITKNVVSKITRSERTLSQWKRKLVKYNELYKMIQNQRHYEGLARIFVPEILRAVETVVGNLYKLLFSNNPWFEYEGLSAMDTPGSEALTKLTASQMEENQFKLRTMDSLRQMAISGLTVRKIMWDFNQVTQRKKVLKIEKTVDPITGKESIKRGTEVIDSVETISDNWSTEPVDLLGFHISDVTTPYHNIQKANWIAEQYIVDKSHIRDKVKRGWYVDKLKELEETNQWQSSEAERLRLDRKQGAGFTSSTGPTSGNSSFTGEPTRKGIEIIERWGLINAEFVYTAKELKELKLDPEDQVESIIIVANREHILKLEANPFWHNMKPYVSCPYVAQDFEFSGMGVSQIAESLQEELNDTRNQTMDNKSLILMCMWLKSRGSGIKNQDLKIRPMGVIQTNDMEGLQPLRPPVLTGVGVNIESVVKEDLRQSVGASSNLQGIAQSGVNTATESSAINQAAAGRLLLTAQQYSELVLKPSLRMAESLNYQFFDVEKTIKVIGEAGVKFQKMSPDDIVGSKTITIRLSTDLDDSPGIRRQQLLQFLTIVQGMPPQVIDYHWRLLDKVYKSFFPSAHSLEDLYQPPPGEEELLTPDEEFEIMRQGIAVKVKQGDNDQEHIQGHEQDLEMTKFALTPEVFKLNKDHILAHYEQMTQKAQQAQMAQEQQMMAMMGGGEGQTGKKPNQGQIPNGSAFTNREATKPSDLIRNNGGM